VFPFVSDWVSQIVSFRGGSVETPRGPSGTFLHPQDSGGNGSVHGHGSQGVKTRLPTRNTPTRTAHMGAPVPRRNARRLESGTKSPPSGSHTHSLTLTVAPQVRPSCRGAGRAACGKGHCSASAFAMMSSIALLPTPRRGSGGTGHPEGADESASLLEPRSLAIVMTSLDHVASTNSQNSQSSKETQTSFRKGLL